MPEPLPIAGDSLIARSSGPVEAAVGSEVVLMSLAAGECYGLGDTASEVWRQLAEPVTLDTLRTRLEAIYDAPPGVIDQDLRELLAEMQVRALIVIG